MKTFLFFAMAMGVLAYLWHIHRRRPSWRYRSVDVVVPAYNEEPCIRATLEALLRNLYVSRVICVNDGSTDRTGGTPAEEPGPEG